ncbi:hypothetical protein VB711_08625 [Cronbergia sp. UHCC 0137]|uniref:hypothetical protein n=1 Tax=Cronbergia sp. UHCC 0137 TaxID=3110239 RepID=UPI002B203410|nr:hypothetical protein [Cronbergia sp. UHCC 0137]MEA5617901.1 hypothetical protein [Cronbergia sp. UHCC 0137]
MNSQTNQSNRDKNFNELKNVLQSKIVLPKESSETGVIELTNEEHEKLVSFWETLISLYEEDKFIILFRGQKKQILENVLSSSFQDEAGKLLCKIFYFGDKAKHFFEYPNNSQDSYLRTIDDTSDDTFNFIFDQIHTILATNYGGDEGIKTEFKLSNIEFTNFFSKLDNKGNFINLINNVKNNKESERERIRDYYLFILHNFGRNFKKKSLFVSTSEDKAEAYKYAIHTKNNKSSIPDKKSVIFLYIVPRPLYKHGINAEISKEFYQDYERQGFPTYSREIHKQEEVAIKGTLFPQYILGLYDLESENFIVNPYIFKKKNLQDFNILKGLYVNQDKFQARIKDTNLKVYVRKTNDMYRDELT